MPNMSLKSPQQTVDGQIAAHKKRNRWKCIVATSLLSAVSLSGTALALDGGPADLLTPIPTSPQEESALWKLQSAEQPNPHTDELDLNPTDRLRHVLAQLGMDPDDPINLTAARLEHGLWTDTVMGGDRAAVVDERYGVNGWGPDQMASASTGTYRTVAAAPLNNGLMVEVNYVNTGTGNANIAIVKRNSRGIRVPWSNVENTFSHHNGQYILYPRNPNLIVDSVHDISVHNNRIYVLLTERYRHTDNVVRVRPHLAIFRDDGSWVGHRSFCGNCNSTIQPGVAMDISSSASGANLVILGRHSTSDFSGGFWTARMSIDAVGNLGAESIANFPQFNGHSRWVPVDIAFRGRTGILNPSAYYVLMNQTYGESTNVDPCLLAVGSNNAPDTGFAAGGIRCMPFNQPGSSNRDVGVAIKTRGTASTPAVEDVWVLVDVARASRSGFGMWKLRNQENDTGFGNMSLGRSLYGGCGSANNGEGCPAPGPIATMPAKTHVPTGLYQISNSLAISGYVDGGPSQFLGGGIRPFFSQQHILSGDLILLGDHPSPYGTAHFLNVTARAGNDFLAVGWTRWPNVTSTAQTALSTRLLRDPDRIFYNGFLCKSGRPGC